MFQHFNQQLYWFNYYQEEDKNKTEENEQQKLYKEAPVDNYYVKQIESLLDDKNNFEQFIPIDDGIVNYNVKKNKNRKKKKKKLPKMKNYNIKKGDWQCKYCFNINFHFRLICNICKRKKSEN